MKVIDKWAQDDGKGGTQNCDFGPLTTEHLESVRRCAFIRGFKLGREQSAKFVEAFPQHQQDGLGLLIRKIGEAEQIEEE